MSTCTSVTENSMTARVWASPTTEHHSDHDEGYNDDAQFIGGILWLHLSYLPCLFVSTHSSLQLPYWIFCQGCQHSMPPYASRFSDSKYSLFLSYFCLILTQLFPVYIFLFPYQFLQYCSIALDFSLSLHRRSLTPPVLHCLYLPLFLFVSFIPQSNYPPIRSYICRIYCTQGRN